MDVLCGVRVCSLQILDPNKTLGLCVKYGVHVHLSCEKPEVFILQSALNPLVQGRSSYGTGGGHPLLPISSYLLLYHASSLNLHCH